MLAWAEKMEPFQDAAPTRRRGLLAAMLVVGPSLLGLRHHNERSDWSKFVFTATPVTTMVAAAHMSDGLAHKYLILRESSAMWMGLTELLSALYEVRLVGSPQPRKSAEEVVALTGALLSALPIRRDSLLPKKPDDSQYLDCQRAATDALRRFTENAQIDLRPRWRRRDRRRRWQWWRPRPMLIVDVDVVPLVAAAARDRAESQV
jgi:hypothetical protein